MDVTTRSQMDVTTRSQIEAGLVFLYFANPLAAEVREHDSGPFSELDTFADRGMSAAV